MQTNHWIVAGLGAIVFVAGCASPRPGPSRGFTQAHLTVATAPATATVSYEPFQEPGRWTPIGTSPVESASVRCLVRSDFPEDSPFVRTIHVRVEAPGCKTWDSFIPVDGEDEEAVDAGDPVQAKASAASPLPINGPLVRVVPAAHVAVTLEPDDSPK